MIFRNCYTYFHKLFGILSFSLPIVLCNDFSVELSNNFEANIEREREKEVHHNMSTFFPQLHLCHAVVILSQEI